MIPDNVMAILIFLKEHLDALIAIFFIIRQVIRSFGLLIKNDYQESNPWFFVSNVLATWIPALVALIAIDFFNQSWILLTHYVMGAIIAALIKFYVLYKENRKKILDFIAEQEDHSEPTLYEDGYKAIDFFKDNVTGCWETLIFCIFALFI